MHGQGIPTEDQGLHQRKLVVQQGSSDTDITVGICKKKLTFALKLVVGVVVLA